MSCRVLVSYHFHRDTDMDDLVARFGGNVDLFADSGAYSAHSTGAEVTLTGYTEWLRRWGHLFSTVSNLDVIGDHDGSAANLRAMEAEGFEPLPVFHVGEPFDVLRAQVEDHPYVALGGMVPHLASGAGNRNRVYLMRWMIKAHLIARKSGAVLHGFGCTGSLFLRDLPFYSADSSSYIFARKRGLIYAWDPQERVIRSFHFRDRAALRRWAHLVRLYGIEPGRLADPGFMTSGTPNFDEDRIDVTAALIRSYVAMEKTLRQRHAVPSPHAGDGLAAMTGTKIYIVNTTNYRVDIEPVLRVAREGLLTS